MKSLSTNNTLKRLFSSLLFVILLVAALYGCTKLTEDKISREIKGSFFESETNMDVIFMGTSHMYNGVLPMELWNEYGIASYNWGYSNSTPAQNYYVLKEVVKYTNPKVVVLDMNGLVEYNDDGNGKYRHDAIMQSRVLFDSFPISLNKIQAVNDLFDDYDNRADFLWDYIIYHSRWASMNSVSDINPIKSTEMGAYFLDDHIGAGFNPISPDDKLDNIEQYVCYDYLIKTLEFCQQKGIAVLGVYLPHVMDDTSQRVANTIGDTFDKYDGCTYFNMINQGILAYNTDMYADGGHVNYSGACKTTSWLGNYLKNNYSLDDYSQNPYWQDCYNKYIDYRISVLQKQDSLINYLMLLKNPGITVSIEFYDENLWYDEVIASEVYFGRLSPAMSYDGPDGCAAHIITYYQDGSVADEAYFYQMDGDYCRK